MRFLYLFLLSPLLAVSALAQNQAVIDCQGKPSIPAWDKPGSILEIKELSCGQNVTVLGLDRGFVKIKINDNLTGFVEAKYVRSLENQADPDRRIADLEVRVKELQQGTPRIEAAKPVEVAPDVRSEAPPRPLPSRSPQSHSYESEQEYPKVEIFGGYNYVHLDNDAGWMGGWNAAIAGNFHSVFGIKAELSGLYAKNTLYSDIKYSAYSFMGGPQLTARSGSIDAFGHALFGVSHVADSLSISGLQIGASVNAFSMAFGGGIDWHREKWGIRIIQADYFPWRAFGSTTHNIRLSAGIILRIH